MNLTSTSLAITWRINGDAAPMFSEEPCFTLADPGYDVWVHLEVAGPVAHSDDFKCDDSQHMWAQLTSEEAEALELQRGLIVYVQPRHQRVFSST